MAVFHEAGKYRAKIGRAALGAARSGTPQVELSLELGGRYDDKDGQLYECPAGNFPPVVYLSLTDSTMGTEVQTGWVAETLAFIGSKTGLENISEVEGFEGDFLCQHGESQSGQPREEWSVLRPREPRPQIEKKAIRELSAKFSKVLKAAARKLEDRANGNTPTTKPQPIHKEVPF